MAPLFSHKTLASISLGVLLAGTPALSQTPFSQLQEQPKTQSAPQVTKEINRVASYDPEAVTKYNLLADALSQVMQVTKRHTFPSGVVRLSALKDALQNAENNVEARAESLMILTSLYLQTINDANSAAIISAGSRIVSRNDKSDTTNYMRGIAKDLRQAGSVAAAQYLEANADRVTQDEYPTSTGVLDAAALSLRYGVSPQPNLAQVLSYDMQEVSYNDISSLLAGLMTRMQTLTQDEDYAQMRGLVERIDDDMVSQIKERIIQAKEERQRILDERRYGGTPPQGE